MNVLAGRRRDPLSGQGGDQIRGGARFIELSRRGQSRGHDGWALSPRCACGSDLADYEGLTRCGRSQAGFGVSDCRYGQVRSALEPYDAKSRKFWRLAALPSATALWTCGAARLAPGPASGSRPCGDYRWRVGPGAAGAWPCRPAMRTRGRAVPVRLFPRRCGRGPAAARRGWTGSGLGPPAAPSSRALGPGSFTCVAALAVPCRTGGG